MKRILCAGLFFCFVVCSSLNISAQNEEGWYVTEIQIGDGINVRYAHNQCATGTDITIFSHGLGGTADQVLHYMQANVFCTDWVASFDFVDAPAHLGKKNVYTGFAQQYEINCCKAALKKTMALKPSGIHIYGISNGASSMINALGQLIDEGADLSCIKTIVLESPYALAHDCIECFSKKSLLPTFFVRFLVKRWFKAANFNTNKPLNAIGHLKVLKVPILFIALKTDAIVPYESTNQLYARLKSVGHTLVELLTVSDASCFHANLMNNAYLEGMHAFYKKHA